MFVSQSSPDSVTIPTPEDIPRRNDRGFNQQHVLQQGQQYGQHVDDDDLADLEFWFDLLPPAEYPKTEGSDSSMITDQYQETEGSGSSIITDQYQETDGSGSSIIYNRDQEDINNMERDIMTVYNDIILGRNRCPNGMIESISRRLEHFIRE